MTQISKIYGIPISDTRVTGFTYDDINTITIKNNDGVIHTITINNLTLNGELNVTGITHSPVFSGLSNTEAVYYGDGSNLGGVSKIDSYLTGATMNGNSLELFRNQGLPILSVDFSQFLDDTNNYLTGATMNGNTLELKRNNGLSDVTVDLSQFIDNTDNYVTGATMNGSVLELKRNGLSDVTVDLSQFLDDTDNYVTGATMNGNILELKRNGLSDVTVDLSSLDTPDNFVTGGTYNSGNIDFTGTDAQTTFSVDVSALIDDTNNYVTGATMSGNILELKRNGLSDVTVDLSQFLDDTNNYVTGATMNGNTLELKRNGLSDVTVDLSQFIDNTDNYVTGATMNGNTLELSRNGLSDVTVDLSSLSTPDNFVTGGTYNSGNIDFVGTNAQTSFAVNVSALIDDTNNYVTGATMDGNTLELKRNGLSDVTVDLSSLDTPDNFVTGGTYNSGNINFTGTDAQTTFSVDVSALIDDTNNYVTGATMNGNTLELKRNGLPDVTVDLSQFLDDTDNYVTGATMNGNTLELKRNGLSDVTVDLSSLSTPDNFVTGGTYNSGNIDFTGTDAQTTFSVDVSSLIDDTNNYVTGATMSGNILELKRSGLSDVTVDLSQLLDDTNNYVTGATMNGNTLELSRNGLSNVTVDLSQFLDNATHTGEVTGSQSLLIDKTAITNKPIVMAMSGDTVLVADSSDSNNLKRVDVYDFLNSSGVLSSKMITIYNNKDEDGGTIQFDGGPVISTWRHFTAFDDGLNIGSAFSRTKLPITSYPSNKSITISGDYTNIFKNNTTFRIKGSTNNDGLYTINNSPTFAVGETTITFVETLNTSVVDGDVCTGQIVVNSLGAGWAIVNFDVSVEANNFDFELAIFHNDVLIPQTNVITNPATGLDWATISSCYPINLTENDTLDLRYRVADGTNDVGYIHYGRFFIYNMSGTKGDKGDTGTPGAGSNIVIQKDDSTIGTVTNTLNIEGSAISSVIDEGSNKTTMTINRGVGQVIVSAITQSTISSTVPDDNTSPDITEGDEIWSTTITPTNTSSRVKIEFGFNHELSVDTYAVGTLYRGNTAICVMNINSKTIGHLSYWSSTYVDSPNTTSAITYSFRAGTISSTSGVLYINVDPSGTFYNGLLENTQVILTELT